MVCLCTRHLGYTRLKLNLCELFHADIEQSLFGNFYLNTVDMEEYIAPRVLRKFSDHTSGLQSRYRYRVQCCNNQSRSHCVKISGECLIDPNGKAGEKIFLMPM